MMSLNICSLNLFVGQVINRLQRYFLSSRSDFFDAFLKMPNRKFRMKIVSGEAFSDETAVPWEGGRIYNPLQPGNEKKLLFSRKVPLFTVIET